MSCNLKFFEQVDRCMVRHSNYIATSGWKDEGKERATRFGWRDRERPLSRFESTSRLFYGTSLNAAAKGFHGDKKGSGAGHMPCPHENAPTQEHPKVFANCFIDSGYKLVGLKDNKVFFLLTSNVNEPNFREGGQLGRGREAREDLGN